MAQILAKSEMQQSPQPSATYQPIEDYAVIGDLHTASKEPKSKPYDTIIWNKSQSLSVLLTD